MTKKSHSRDELANELLGEINKKFKDSSYTTAYFLEGSDSEFAPTNVRDFVSTGCEPLDIAVSNILNGGLPVGRITEVNGMEGSGKSLLAAHALATTQNRGGVAVFIDTESSVSLEFFKALGVDLKSLVYIQQDSIEDAFETIETIIYKVRASNKDRLVTIIVDSIAGATTKVEQEEDYDKQGYATTKSILMSKGLRKITQMIARERICLIMTNQLRIKLNAMGDPYTTSGGVALQFHSSVRIRLKILGKLKDESKKTIGIKVRATTIKNRITAPYKSIEYNIYFDSGIDNYECWLSTLKAEKIIKTSGAWHQYVDTDTGEVIKFYARDFKEQLIDRPEIKKQLELKMLDALKTEYKVRDEMRNGELDESTIPPDEEDISNSKKSKS